MLNYVNFIVLSFLLKNMLAFYKRLGFIFGCNALKCARVIILRQNSSFIKIVANFYLYSRFIWFYSRCLSNYQPPPLSFFYFSFHMFYLIFFKLILHIILDIFNNFKVDEATVVSFKLLLKFTQNRMLPIYLRSAGLLTDFDDLSTSSLCALN